MRILSRSDAVLRSVSEAIHAAVGGIRQADHKGFSNEDGNQIVWQFSDTVQGPWWVAARISDDWVTYQMHLGDPHHRAAFLAADVPVGSFRRSLQNNWQRHASRN